ncbi:Pvc16 family protein [Amycolatopsis anabasis]|uniref:Pvc16 family protein n=1 Tax=Amycolatopsis anabasis TaxID=1840409 RepID=UPI00131AC7A5|nr:Pvc16 family protein [Amycolatopsis anabasis]
MITQVDDALCQLLGRNLPQGTVVRLDPPKPTWQTETPARAVDLFLFGLADDRASREAGSQEVRDARGAVVRRSDPVRRCELSYLVTARAPEVRGEHELLDHALRVMVFADAVPESCFDGEFDHGGLPVLLRVADTGPGQLWSSLGMPARAAFVATVSVPMPPEPETDLAKPAEKLALRSGRKVPPKPRKWPLTPAGNRRWQRIPPPEEP